MLEVDDYTRTILALIGAIALLATVAWLACEFGKWLATKISASIERRNKKQEAWRQERLDAGCTEMSFGGNVHLVPPAPPLYQGNKVCVFGTCCRIGTQVLVGAPGGVWYDRDADGLWSKSPPHPRYDPS